MLSSWDLLCGISDSQSILTAASGLNVFLDSFEGREPAIWRFGEITPQ
jgi:hypothetical protein